MSTKKKDFDAIDTMPAFTDIETAAADPVKERKPRREYSEQEQQVLRLQGSTQGRKGAHMQRMNISILPGNYEYVKTMAAATAMPQTEFINKIISEHRQRNAEVYEQARQFQKLLK
jgi:hypothetical protein